MRPLKAGRTIAAGVGVAALLGAMVAPMALAGPDADADGNEKSRLERLERHIHTGRDRQRALDRRANQLAAEIRAIQHQLVAAAAALQSEEDRITGLEGRLGELGAVERKTVQDLHRRKRELTATVGALTRLSRQPPQALIASPISTTDTIRSSVLLRTVVADLEGRSRTLQGQLLALSELRVEIRIQRQAHETALAALGQKRQRLDQLLDDKSRARSRALRQQHSERRRLAELAATARDLRSLIRRLEENEAKAGQAVAAPREAEQRTAERLVAATPSVPDESADAAPSWPEADRQLAQIPAPAPERSFGLGQGRLPLPARGRVIARFGQPDDAGAAAKGISIETRYGAAVVSPNDGKVMFAGLFRGYGELLIIALGEGYHILLAGLARTDVSVGQWLLAGEPVGLMAEYQSSTDSGGPPRLYVELRHNGEPVNPLQWMTADKRKVSG